MIQIVWPTVVHCVFAAFLHSGTGEADPQIRTIPVNQPSMCQSIRVSVKHRSVVLVKGIQRVEIPLPLDKSDKGWKPLKYWWGIDKAFIGDHIVNVKMGPEAVY